MTKQDFKDALRAQLLERYGKPNQGLDSWAADPARLEKFMASVDTTLTTNRNTVSIDSPSFAAAWRAIGCKGKPTYKALRALAD